MLRASILPLVSSLLGCGNKSGAQQLPSGGNRVCRDSRAGAKKTNDVSFSQLELSGSLGIPAPICLGCGAGIGASYEKWLVFMQDLAAAGEGGQSVSWLSSRIALGCLPQDNGKFL